MPHLPKFRALYLVAPLALLSSFTVGACSKTAEPTSSSFTPAEGKPAPPPPKELEKIDTKEGTGPACKTGDRIKVHYTGTLMDGTKFDSTDDHDGEPFEVTLGEGGVIKGWDQGIPGMKVGGKRTLVIPPALGYGAEGSPPNIPGNAGLKFDIELVEVED